MGIAASFNLGLPALVGRSTVVPFLFSFSSSSVIFDDLADIA